MTEQKEKEYLEKIHNLAVSLYNAQNELSNYKSTHCYKPLTFQYLTQLSKNTRNREALIYHKPTGKFLDFDHCDIGIDGAYLVVSKNGDKYQYDENTFYIIDVFDSFYVAPREHPSEYYMANESRETNTSVRNSNNISKKEREKEEKQEMLKRHGIVEYNWMWRMKGHEYQDKIK